MIERRLVFLVVLLATAGCGSSQSGTDEKQGARPQTTRPKSYRAALADCARDVAYTTRNAGNALRIESPGGRLVANVQVFRSASAAQRFEDEVLVEHAYGGRGVAVWLRDANGSDKEVVTDCLTP